MRLTKIYTKVGDKGMTSLANGEQKSKSHARIHAYGTVDELNAFVGLLRDELSQVDSRKFSELILQIAKIQNELFDVGGELSTPFANLKVDRQQVVGAKNTGRLEAEIDAYNSKLEPLANFVLPGGHRANSMAHVARTVCRRAERHVVELSLQETVRPEVLIYLNRLSDWFFVAGRQISHALGVPEVLWAQQK